MFGSNQKLDFTDIVSDHNSSTGSRSRWGGCYVKTTTGFILAMLAICIAVGVGLIVHFAGNSANKPVQCNCKFLDSVSTSGGLTTAVSHPDGPRDPLKDWLECEDLAVDRNRSMCDMCFTTTAVTTTTASSDGLPTAVRDVRLPTSLEPLLYEVELQPNIYEGDSANFSFDGFVRIQLLCKRSTRNITLHMNQLTLQNSTIQIRKVPPTPSAPSLLRYEVDKVRQFCIFHLDGSLKPGSTYTIEMRYSGPLKDDLAGLYLSSYMRGNQTVYMATTQFQPTDARRAFPCFDEPAIKSKFKVTLVRKAHMTSLSNMPRTETVNRENGFVADIYNTTAKMSTYLLAFIICDFKSLEQRTKSGVQYRVWARPEAINQAKFALDVGVKILDFYEKYFNIEFPLPKQDMIAIPDFSAGAMENWGLITYRETAMLYEPGVSSEGNKQRVATVVSHELAHQWFGNLVSPAWWDDLWLNEGFATYLEYIGVDTVFPEWKMLDQFVNTDFQTVLSSDGLLTSHPLYVPVFNPNEINEIFDQISYNKGASIVRMMKFFLSENTFRNGLTNYLRNLSYAAATHDDLWKFLAAQSHTDGQKLDVKNIMDTWTLQMNYPVVTVTREGENQLFLTQERFLMNPNASSELKYNSTYGYRWEIPITYTTSKEKNFEKTKHDVIWMKHEGSGSKHTHSDLNLPPVSDKYGWIIANIKQYGYYRVNYEKKNWRALITQMDKKHKVIHPINRAQIINDAWNLARANLLDQEIALETLEYLDKEEDLNVWSAAVSQMSYLDTMLQFTEAYGDFRSFKRKKFIKLYKKLGWNNTGAAHLESFTRSLTAAEMCELDDSSCVKEAQSQFRQWMTNEDENPIDPGLKFTAYCTAIRKGGVEEWDFAYRQYKRSNVASEKRRLLSALSCSRKSWILNKYLQKSLLTEEIRKQDATSIIIYVSRNPVGRSLAWVFVQSKWEYIRKTFGQSFFSFSSLINGITHSFNTKYDLEQLNEFQSKHKDMGSGTRAFQQALERTQTNIDWMEKNFKVVQTWLENQADSDQKKVEDLRLPKALEPISYQVELKPDIYGSDASKFSFDGFVRIHVRCKIETANVTIHIHKLTLKNNSMHFGTLDGSRAPSVSTYEEDEIRQFLIVYLSAGLKPGAEYFISMNFTGPLKNDLVGLYLSSYARADRTVYLAASQLQATHARKTFPCFDEPAMKATFNVTLLRQPNMTSLSNMPVDRSENRSDGYIADIYLTTPKMSTYLMAFIVCDFEYRKNITANGAKFQVWSRAEAVDQTAYSLDIGVKVTEYFEKFFDIPYNLPKQDMIAIPDFSAGAMENWGLITYRESVMLYKKGVSARENQQFVALVVSHELAHMWFGNLVTLEWWDDVWLNEGFATYLEYFGMDSVHPEWKMFDQFVADMHVAFEYDQLASSHPLHVPVNTPNEISEIFDAIEYTKGSCILRMLKLIIGDSTFQNSLRLYLKSLLYKSTTYDKLWDVIQQQLDKDGKKLNISKIMNTWILQMNFPVVKISQTGNHTLAVSQKRFLLDTGTKVASKHVSPYGYKWEIPLTFATSRNGIFTTTSDIKWISADQDSRNITDVNLPQPDDSHGLIIGNVGQYGYYRVNYEDSNWYAIIQQLKDNHKLIDINNRAQIINDAWNLAKAGMLSQKIALGTVEYLDKEEKYIPWKIAMREMGFVKKMLGFTSTYGLLQKFMVTKIKPLYKKIGWGSEDDDHLKWYLRQIILELACEYGMPDCIQQAKRLYKSWMNNERQNTIAPDLRYIVYCIAIKDGGIDEWDFAYRQYKASNVASERLCLLSALACSVEPWILSRYLERSIDPNEIKRQDASIVIVYISRNSVGRSLAWNFVLSKWNFLIKSSFLLSQLLSGITVSFNTETDLQKLTDFENEQHDLGGATRALAQAKEKTRGNIKWMKNNYGVIKDWLQSQTEGSTEKVTDVRLPTSLEPELYRLELKPDIYSNNSADFRFEGSVTIEMLCKETTSNITVHANNLDIQKDSVKVGIVGSSKMIQIQQQMEDKIREFYIVALTHNLTAGERYFIQIRFSAPLKANLYGLYLSSYKRENKTVYLATTQFQPTHARKAFPCFDEPAIKARFDVTLVRKSNMISLANTKINTTVSRSDNYVADLYTRTAKMSTYLLAFVVCDFTNITRQAGNITFSVWARQEVINQSRFALDIGINIITYFEKYFGISYPLAKQDMIAIPDFASGAMENWGLITYREIAMLYDEGMSSLNDKQTVAIVVSHELAHQWFGNLVTPAWWDDLWLNEGFASYMEYVGVDHAQPKWKMFEQFTIETVQSVLSTDSLASSHPVYVPVAHANEISEIFDSISYSKGASIIRMMKFFLGEDKFRSGLTLYLTNLSYAAAFHDDLWKALSQASDMNVKKIMDTWTLQMNYPVVTIKILEAGQMEVTQERYLLDPSATYKEKYRSPFNYRWEIPFTFTSSIENNFNKSSSDVVWIHKTDNRKRIFNASIPASSNESWVVGNIQQYGFYRVNYEESNWRALIGQLKHNHSVIDTINRAQLINDAWNLAKSGHLMQKYALGLLEYLENEEDYVVWNTATGELNYIGKMLSRSEAYGIFQNFIQKKTQRLYNKLGWNNSQSLNLDNFLRYLVIGMACKYGAPECVKEAVHQYKLWMNDTSYRIDPNLRSAVYCIGIREGGAEEWNFAYTQYHKSIVATEKVQLLISLTCSQKTWILSRYLQITLDPKEIRRQDVISVIAYISWNHVGRSLAWDFVRANWDKLNEKHGSASIVFPYLVTGITHSFNTVFELDQFHEFMDQNPDRGSAARAFSQAEEVIRGNIKWMKENYELVSEWLTTQVKG